MNRPHYSRKHVIELLRQEAAEIRSRQHEKGHKFDGRERKANLFDHAIYWIQRGADNAQSVSPPETAARQEEVEGDSNPKQP